MSEVTKPIMLDETGLLIAEKLSEVAASNKAYEALLNTKADKTDLASPFVFKGNVEYAALPTSGNEINDTYYCTDKMCRYTWNGTEWFPSSLSEVEYLDALNKVAADAEAQVRQLSSEIVTNIRLAKEIVAPMELRESLSWCVGFLNAQGVLDETRKYRVSTRNVHYTEDDLYILKESNTYLWVFFYNGESVSIVEYNQKVDNCKIPKGSYFKLQFSVFPFDTSIVYSDYHTLTDKITIMREKDIDRLANHWIGEEVNNTYSHFNDCKAGLYWTLGKMVGGDENSITRGDSSRIVTPFLNYADAKLKVEIPKAFYVWVAYFTENDEFINIVEHGNTASVLEIPKGSYFRIQVADSPLDSSIVYDTWKNKLYEGIKIYKVSDEYMEKTSKSFPNTLNDSIVGSSHRGLAGLYPENTLIAFRNCYKNGMYVWEVDVKKTADGVLVLLHDSTINRTARNADGTTISQTINIADITYAEVLKYDFGIYKGVEFAGEKIPTLSEFLKLAKKLNCYVQMDGWSDEILAEVYTCVKNVGMLDRTIWSSFSLSGLETLKNMDSHAKLIYLQTVINYKNVDTFANLKTDFNTLMLCLSSTIATNEVFQYARNLNMSTGIYCLDTKESVLEWADNVDFIVTNSVQIRQVIEENA